MVSLYDLRAFRRWSALGVICAAFWVMTFRASAAGLPPVAAADTYSITANTPLVVSAPGPLGNDSDPENDPIWITAMLPSQFGVVTEIFSNGQFTYIPNTDFTGVDVLYYQITDGGEHSPVFATITIYVGVSAGSNLLNNGGFEDASETTTREPQFWKLNQTTAATNAKRVCSTFVAQEGQCAFRFKGRAGIKTTLVQTLSPETPFIVGDTLVMSLYARSVKANAKTRVRIKIAYTDTTLGTNGKVKTKLVVSHGTVTEWRYYSTDPITLEGEVASVKVLVQHTSIRGKVWIDNLKMIHNGEVAPLAIPLPPALTLPAGSWVAVPFVG